MLSFRLQTDNVSPSLARLASTARNPVAVLRTMGTTFLSITQGNFNSVGARFRPTPWPALKDPPGAPSILQRSGALARALHLTVMPTAATVAQPMRYGRVHQLGATIRPKNAKVLSWVNRKGQRVIAKSVTIPPRPYFPVLNDRITPEAEALIRRAGERTIARQAGGSAG